MALLRARASPLPGKRFPGAHVGLGGLAEGTLVQRVCGARDQRSRSTLVTTVVHPGLTIIAACHAFIVNPLCPGLQPAWDLKMRANKVVPQAWLGTSKKCLEAQTQIRV